MRNPVILGDKLTTNDEEVEHRTPLECVELAFISLDSGWGLCCQGSKLAWAPSLKSALFILQCFEGSGQSNVWVVKLPLSYWPEQVLGHDQLLKNKEVQSYYVP